MASRQSTATDSALRHYIKGGLTVYAAAYLAGIQPSTLYRALARRKKPEKKKLAKRVA